MSSVKAFLRDNSVYRIMFLVVLFLRGVSFAHMVADDCIKLMLIWGIYLTYRNIRVNKCFDTMRFSLWLICFMAVHLITTLVNYSSGIDENLKMFAHLGICFFIFYGMHTEKCNAKKELYFISKFIIYATTVLGAAGFILMMCGVKFEWRYIKFIIYENRFTGLFTNPNILGFVSVVSLVCCQIVMKEDFLVYAEERRVSRIWIAACLAVDFFSLTLCDSNASMVMFICYIVVIVVFNMFSMTAKLSLKQIFLKLMAILMSAVFVAVGSFMVRNICQRTFTNLVKEPAVSIGEVYPVEDEEFATFEHENENVDSGRIKLNKEGINLFKLSPVIGIGKGNIVHYSDEYLTGYMTESYNKDDLHNGYLTILVSTGLLGFLIFAIFGFRFSKHIASSLFKRQNASSQDILPCLFAFCCAYLVYALVEKALLFNVSFMVMWFWYIVGQVSVYLNKYEPLSGAHYMMHDHRLPRHML